MTSSWRSSTNKTRLLSCLGVCSYIGIAANLTNSHMQPTLQMMMRTKEQHADTSPHLCPSKTVELPVFHSESLPNHSPLSVGLVTKKKPFEITTRHVLIDGLKQSKYLNLTRVCLMNDDLGCDFDSTVDLWIIDFVRWRPRDADSLRNHPLVQQLLRLGRAHSSPSPPQSFQVLLLDYADQIDFVDVKSWNKLGIFYWSNNTAPSANIDNTHQHVRLALSSIVQGRRYDHNQNQIRVGKRVSIEKKILGGGPILQTPYAVRTDIVQGMGVRNTSAATQKHHNPLCAILMTERLMDVIHLWEPENLTKIQRYAARYRGDVSELVQSLNGTTITTVTTNNHPPRTLQTSIQLQGPLGLKGRNKANKKYIEAMLSSKIVVVTQRDMWEDHYRLMEALSSGAMVLSDQMLSLPRGLKNGTNIVLFETLACLQTLIHYYVTHDDERLDVAQRGWELAMCQHRSWHRLEELIFGCPLTAVLSPMNSLCSQERRVNNLRSI